MRNSLLQKRARATSNSTPTCLFLALKTALCGGKSCVLVFKGLISEAILLCRLSVLDSSGNSSTNVHDSLAPRLGYFPSHTPSAPGLAFALQSETSAVFVAGGSSRSPGESLGADARRRGGLWLQSPWLPFFPGRPRGRTRDET